MDAAVASVEGQQVLVMGGSSGVGLATAQELTRRGASVTITGRTAPRLAQAQQRLRGEGLSVETAAVDAADASAVFAFFADFGAYDHLVLAVSGGAGAGSFAELDLDGLRTGFAGKLWPQLTALQAGLASLRADGSATLVTAISSGSAQPGTAGLAAINGALEAVVPTLAVELAPRRVNAVAPGVIDTPWWDFLGAARSSTFASYADRTPARRVGQPGDVADAIAFVVANTFVTGVVLPCDGGLRLPRP